MGGASTGGAWFWTRPRLTDRSAAGPGGPELPVRGGLGEHGEVRSVSELRRLRRQLIGSDQLWTRMCGAARLRGPAAVLGLLDPSSAPYRALAESTRHWSTYPPNEAGAPGVLADEGDEDSPEVSAARAVAALAIGLCRTGRGSLSRATVEHWDRARLPAFDERRSFPPQMVSGLDDNGRSFMTRIESATFTHHRGFLALLARELAGGRTQTRREVRIPVLFDRGAGGGSGSLRLAVLAHGPAGLHPDPGSMAFFMGDDGYREAVERAWRNCALRVKGASVVWSVSVDGAPCNDVRQGSLGAAFAVGLHELSRRRTTVRLSPRQLDRRCAVTAAVDQRGVGLLPVSGYERKLRAAQEAKLRRVVVAAGARLDPAFPVLSGDPRVVEAATVREAVRRTRRRPNPVFVGSLVVVLLALTAVTVAGRLVLQAEDDADRAERDTARARETRAGQALVAAAESARDATPPDFRTALALGAAAYRNLPSQTTQASLAETLASTRFAGTLTGHADAVAAVAVSPDGRTLASASWDGTTILWDLTVRAEPRQIGRPLVGDAGFARSVAFSPDGKTLATGYDDSVVILWDVAVRESPRMLENRLDGHTDLVSSVRFSPDGDVLAVGCGDKTVVLWDVRDRTRPRRLGPASPGHEGRLSSVAFSPDGRTLAANDYDQAVSLWDVTDPASPRSLGAPLEGHAGSVESVAFSPDGVTLATIGEDGVIFWDLTVPGAPRRLGQPIVGAQHTVVFSPDGASMFAVSGDRSVARWDIADRERARQVGVPYVGHAETVNELAISPDGRTLATGSVDKSVILWDASDSGVPRRGRTLAEYGGDVLAQVAFSPDGRTLASAVDTASLTLWDPAGRLAPRRFQLPAGGETGLRPFVVFSPDGALVAVAGAVDGTVALWDVTARDGAPRLLRRSAADREFAVSAAFTPDGRTLATGMSDHTVVLWDVATGTAGKVLGESQQHSYLQLLAGIVWAVAFSPDGNTLAVGGATDSTVVFWDVTDREAPREISQTLAGHTSAVMTLAYATDGRTLVTGSIDTRTILFDVTDRYAPRIRNQPLTAHGKVVWSVDFSRDSGTLVTADGDGLLALWDTVDPNGPRRLGNLLAGQADDVTSVSLSPDGRTLAVGTGNGIVLWDLNPLADLREDPLSFACARGAGGLDPSDWELRAPGVEFRDPCVR